MAAVASSAKVGYGEMGLSLFVVVRLLTAVQPCRPSCPDRLLANAQRYPRVRAPSSSLKETIDMVEPGVLPQQPQRLKMQGRRRSGEHALRRVTMRTCPRNLDSLIASLHSSYLHRSYKLELNLLRANMSRTILTVHRPYVEHTG